MEFRLLGLLEVLSESGPVQIARGRESALLALLLLHANEPLSTDRIVDGLWGERAPENAVKSVHIYVSRLRKAIGADRIGTTSVGYRLRVEPGELDLAAFEALASDGQAALEDGRVDAAESLLDEALSLWRGEALADFEYDAFAQAESRRLHERRDVAYADRIDARLARGRAQDLIPELEALVERLPLWERPCTQLMLALYRSGRQADALEVARRARARFVDELGLEPGSAVHELERQILNHDPALRPRAIVPARLQRRRRQSLFLVLCGAAVLAAAAVAAVLLTHQTSGVSLAPVTPNSLAMIDPRSNSVVAEIPIGSSPSSVSVGPSGVFIANAGDQSLALVDPSSKSVIERIGLGAIPGEVVTAGSSVWVTTANPNRGSLLEIDPGGQTVRLRPIPVSNDDLFAPPEPNAIAAVGASVWANAFHSRIVHVSDVTAPSLYQLGPDHSADGIAYGDRSLWVSSSVDDKVLRVDPRDGRIIVQIPLAAVSGRRVAGPYGIAYGAGAVWVAAALEDRVVRIDPRTNGVTAAIAVGRRPTDVVVESGSVWALNAGDGTVSRIDPAAARVTKTIPVGRDVTGIAAGDGAVWATVAGATTADRGSRFGYQPLSRRSCGPVLTSGGKPDLLLVSDLPTYLAPNTPATGVDDMRRAILGVLRSHGFRAGRFRLAYQACNDGPAATGVTPESCAANARSFAAAGVAAVIGPFYSSCAKIEVPILDTAPHGPIAALGPTTTYVGLTHSGPTTAVDEPDRYYPLRVRNFVRLLGADDAQGAALAELARELGARRVFILDDGDPTAEAMTGYVANAARRLGLHVVGARHWTGVRSKPAALAHFGPLATAVATARPDAVVLTGCICTNGPALVIALRRALGRRVALLGSDNFTFATDMSRGTPALLGMYLTSAGTAPSRLPADWKRFLAALFPRRPLSDIDASVVLAAQATEAALDAVTRANGTYGSVAAALTRDPRFDRDGDPMETPFTVVRVSADAPFENDLGMQGVVVDRIVDADASLAAPATAAGR